MLVQCAQTPGCKVCATDYTLCTLYASAGYFFGAGTTTCTSTIPDGFGPNLSTGMLVQCAQTPGCKVCATDYTLCTLCDASAGYFFGAGTTTCTSTIPDGFGPNLSTGMLVQCAQTPGCKVCATDYTLCTLCDASAGYSLLPSLPQCTTTIPIASIPAGFGWDPSTQSFLPCTQAGCVLCPLYYKLCAKCDQNNMYYLDPVESRCVLAPNFPIRKGPDKVTGLVSACVDIHCMYCNSSILQCDRCDIDMGYYLDRGSGLCVHYLTIGIGKGGNSTSGWVEPCVSPGCADCRQAITSCVSCLPTPFYCHSPTTQTCLLSTQYPPYYGCNILTQSLAPCLQPGCVRCPQDRAVCEQCDKVNYPSCSSGVGGVLGWDAESGSMRPCRDGRCVECTLDYRICIYCDTANGYILLSGQCIQKTSKALKVQNSLKSISQGVVKIAFDDPVQITPINGLRATLIEPNTGRLWTSDDGSITFSTIDNYLQIDLSMPENIRNATLTLDRAFLPSGYKSPLSTLHSTISPEIIFQEYPITMKSVTFYQKTDTQQAISTFSTTITAASKFRSGATLLLILSNPAVAVLLDKMFCDFTFLSLLGTHNQTYPKLIFEFVEKSALLPVDLPNWFEGVVEDEECEPASGFAANGFDCNFLVNSGSDVIAMGFTLAVNTVFSLAGLAAMGYLHRNKIAFLAGALSGPTTEP
jgi:hypothetical protein